MKKPDAKERFAGIWIDHSKAVIVSLWHHDAVCTLRSGVEGHPHYAGAQDGGGEKKYEERHALQLNRFYDTVAATLDQPDALFVFGPGQAKFELRRRLEQVLPQVASHVSLEPADKLTEAQIVAKTREHYDRGDAGRES